MVGYTGQYQNNAVLRVYANTLKDGDIKRSEQIARANPDLAPCFRSIFLRRDLLNKEGYGVEWLLNVV